MEEIEEIINTLGLQPHPEGGFYGETYRSEEVIPGKERNLLTSIYFLLTDKNVSRFHRIKSDELWYFHTGSTVIVHTLDENGHCEHLLGNDFSKGERPYLMVPKDTIFGSSIKGSKGYAFVSCAVAPGFDFRDFELLSREELLQQFPANTEIIDRLT
jgi:predicted cupin superfamily sugar epimerase